MTHLIAPFVEDFDGPRGYRYAPPFDSLTEGEHLGNTDEAPLHCSRLQLSGDGSLWVSSGPYPLIAKLPNNYAPGDDPFPTGTSAGVISMPLKQPLFPSQGNAVPYGSQLSFGVLPLQAYENKFEMWLSEGSPGPNGWGELFIKRWNTVTEPEGPRGGNTVQTFYDASLMGRLTWQANGRIRFHAYGFAFGSGFTGASYTVQSAGNALPEKISVWFDILDRLNIALDDVWQFAISLSRNSSLTTRQFFVQEPMLSSPSTVSTYSVALRVMFPVIPEQLSGGAWNPGKPILGEVYRGERYKILDAMTSWWDFAGTLPDTGVLPALHQNRSDFLGAGGVWRAKSYTLQSTIWQNAPY